MIEVRISVPKRPLRTYRLIPGEYTLGRGIGCDIRLRHGSVAPRHARLVVSDAAADISIHHIEGAGPLRRKAGGTLTQATVHSGDVFQLGECELQVASGWTMALRVGPSCAAEPSSTVCEAAGSTGTFMGASARTAGLQTEQGQLIAARATVLALRPHAGLWLARKSFPADVCVLSASRRLLHTIGAPRPIDVVFLNAQLKILGWQSALVPWRFRRAPSGTRFWLSLPEGHLAKLALCCGTFLCLLPEQEPRSLPTALQEAPAVRSPRPNALFSLRLPLARGAPEARSEAGRRPGR